MVSPLARQLAPLVPQQRVALAGFGSLGTPDTTTGSAVMTDETKLITRQAIAAKERSGKLMVTGKLKVALDEMLYKGSRRADAASASGMTDHGLREALKKPHVKRYYLDGLEVLRTSERARNISALAKVRDESENGMAVVSAAKALEQLAEPNGPGGIGGGRRGAGWAIDLSEPTQAGLVIVIEQRAPQQPRDDDDMIDVTPSERDHH